MLRCPYHGWTYRLDGSIRTIPIKSGYEGTGLAGSSAAAGIVPVRNVATHRGFVFARLAETGPGFHEYFGDALSSIDNMVDRSPLGRLEVAGGTLRYLHDSNWKMFVENLNDTMHPMVSHESAAGTAKKLWTGHPEDEPKPMAIEQFLPFVNGYEFFDKMGVRIYDNGHSYSGVRYSIHSQYSAIGEYERLMEQAYGAERARQILGEVRHNTVYYPSLTIKGAIQAIRVARPIAPDRTRARKHDVPAGRRAGFAAAAHTAVFAADQRSDLDRGARRPAQLPRDPGGARHRWQRMGEPASKPQPRRGGRSRGRLQRLE